MSVLLVASTGTESTLGFDFMSMPDYLAKLAPAAKRTLSHLLMTEARKLVEAEGRHTIRPGFEEAAEYAVMSSDMDFDTIIDLDNAMCFVAFGMQVERERFERSIVDTVVDGFNDAMKVGQLRRALRDVLERDAKWAPSGAINDCGCIGLSRAAEREYETGKCPHQVARKLICEEA